MEDLQELLSSDTRSRLLGRSLGLSLLSEELLSSKSLGVRVESEENGLVLEGVLLLGEGSCTISTKPLARQGGLLTLGDGLTSWSEDRLDLVRVDESGDVRSGDLGGGEVEARLLLVDLVEGGNGALGPDDESTDVSSGSELEQVELINGASLDSWNVLESSDNSLVFGVDDQRTSSLSVSSVSHLSLSSSDLSRVGDLGNIGVGRDSLQQLDGSLGLGSRLDGGRDDKGDLLDLLDSVSSGKDERRESRSGNGGSNGVSLLVLVDLDVPFSPSLGRGEHSTTSAHVTESGLSGSLGSSTTDTGDTGDGSTGTPRLGGGLVTSVLGDGVRLSLVLGDRLCEGSAKLYSGSTLIQVQEARDPVIPPAGSSEFRLSYPPPPALASSHSELLHRPSWFSHCTPLRPDVKDLQLTVDLLNDVQSDRSSEDRREGERARRLSLGGPDSNGRSSGHFL